MSRRDFVMLIPNLILLLGMCLVLLVVVRDAYPASHPVNITRPGGSELCPDTTWRELWQECP